MVAKVRVAVAERRDPDFLVIARTGAVRHEGFDAAIDRGIAYAEAGADLIMLFPAIRDGGGFATVRGFRGETPRGITLHSVFVRDYVVAHDKLDGLRQQADDGAIALRVARTFSPEEAGEAHKMLEAGGVRGRLVIEF
jgi:hypothetical protein